MPLELPFSYFDERGYQREFTYEKTFSGDPSWSGKDVCLHFDGAMANATVDPERRNDRITHATAIRRSRHG